MLVPASHTHPPLRPPQHCQCMHMCTHMHTSTSQRATHTLIHTPGSTCTPSCTPTCTYIPMLTECMHACTCTHRIQHVRMHPPSCTLYVSPWCVYNMHNPPTHTHTSIHSQYACTQVHMHAHRSASTSPPAHIGMHIHALAVCRHTGTQQEVNTPLPHIRTHTLQVACTQAHAQVGTCIPPTYIRALTVYLPRHTGQHVRPSHMSAHTCSHAYRLHTRTEACTHLRPHAHTLQCTHRHLLSIPPQCACARMHTQAG